MQNNFAVTSSPHLRAKATSQRIMQEVCLALAPAGIASIILFGVQAAIVIAVCVVSCVLAELGWQLITKQKVTVSDWSAVVTGLLLAYNLPATAPWWMAVIGSIVAIVLVKQFFGGIGNNFMNPALTARAVLFISWSTLMNASSPTPMIAIDVVSGATPLATLNEGSIGALKLMDLLIGAHGGMLGETCAIALILGGLYLILRGIVDWRIPASFIGTVFVCYLIKDGAQVALYQILAGG
ncbi:MAG: RnfABCDGE type electron transport complex subunit D, partial [Clostridia bacterium]|nr:RnfABCDGE type electron transport complex subunit D [Clostridia bacterium]